MRESETMSPFKSNTVIDLLKRKGKDTDVRVFNYKKGWNGTRNSTYLLRTFYDALEDYADDQTKKPMVAFLSGFNAEETANARKTAEEQVKAMNGLLIKVSTLIAAEVERGNTPELLKLVDWVPQITNEETDFIPTDNRED